jgi:AcrR family transcriptional regulator
MQQIADAAGLRKASIYYHFRDKNALFTEIVLIEMRRIRGTLQAIADEGRSVRPTLEAIATEYLATIRSDVVRLVADYRQHVPETHHEEVHAELFRLAGLFQQIFADAVTHGVALSVDPRFAGVFYMQMMMALLFHVNGQLGVEIEPAEGATLVTSALLDGILRRE